MWCFSRVAFPASAIGTRLRMSSCGCSKVTLRSPPPEAQDSVRVASLDGGEAAEQPGAQGVLVGDDRLLVLADDRQGHGCTVGLDMANSVSYRRLTVLAVTKEIA